MATFRASTFNVQDGNISRNIHVRWYELPISALTIRRLSRTNGQLDLPGVNASFFHAGIMSSIHWFNGRAVHTGGDTNLTDGPVNTSTSMSCMFHTSQGVSLRPRAVNINDLLVAPSSINWAIGGFSLFLNETHNGLQSMISRYASFYSGMAIDTWVPALRGRRARTFIAANPSQNRLCIGVMSTNIDISSSGVISDDFQNSNLSTGHGATYFDMHSILRNNLNCNIGMAIDGGGSTRLRRISRITGNSPIQYTAQRDPNRNVLCQLSFLGAQPN